MVAIPGSAFRWGNLTLRDSAPLYDALLYVVSAHRASPPRNETRLCATIFNPRSLNVLVAHCSLESLSPYSSSRVPPPGMEKGDKESFDAYEERIWREKAHFNEEGHVVIPPMAFKFALVEAGKLLGERIKGKGMATWTKRFTVGAHVDDPVVLHTLKGGKMQPILKDDLVAEWIYANADGKRGGSTRVYRCFPTIAAWSGLLTFNLYDATITQDVFERTLRECGNFVGVGRFRCEKGGRYGRFQVAKIAWSESQAA